MAVLYKRPDSLSLSGNLHPFEMTSANNVRFKLFKGETLLLNHSYAPGEDNRVVIDVRQVIESNLAFTLQAGETSYLQPNLAANFKVEIDDEEYSFRVIRSGVANLADTAYNWLKLHFLTWQPAEKKVTYYSPEWLTYYAVDDCSIKIHAYFDDGTDEEKVLLKCTEGNAYTVDVQYACMARLFNNKLPMYYDVSAYFGVGQIIRSEIQRYLADSARSEDEEWISWENSLGGYDTARVYGTNAFTGEHTHNISSVNDISNEYDIETKRKYSKNTGHINKYERRWLLDFFPAQVKYIHTGDTLRRIVVTEDNVTYKSSDLPSSYTFTYQYAESKPYLNLQKQENLPAGITIPIPNLPDFILPPRIIEYPRIPLSEGVLFPVQDPNSERLGITTLGEIKKLIGAEEFPSLEGFLTIAEFNKFFKKDTYGNVYTDENFYSLKSVTARRTAAGEESPAGGSLGSLVNVGTWADSVPSFDRLMIQPAGSTHWTEKRLSEIVGLDTEALAQYLTANNYITQTALGNYLTTNNYAKTTDIPTNHITTDTFNTHVLSNLHLTEDQRNVLSKLKVDANGLLYTKESFYSLKSITARRTGETGDASFGSLGSLVNVGAWADTAPAADRVMVQLADATHWSAKPLSEVVGLDTTALLQYLTTNNYAKKTDIPSLTGYATQTWVNTQLAGNATQTWVNTQLGSYAKKTDLPSLAGYATETWVTTRINNLINGAPAAYDTLKEIADVLQGNVSSIGDILTTLGTKWTQNNIKISNWDTAYSWGNHTAAGYLTKNLFDELFEKVAVGNSFEIRAKYSFSSLGSIVARKTGDSSGSSYGSLGSLVNVGAWADVVPSASRIMVQLSGATHWSSKLLSEVVGLDTTALASYLTANGYYNSTNLNAMLHNVHIYATSFPTNQVGYGYEANGWIGGAGPAMSFGTSGYVFQLQNVFGTNNIYFRNVYNNSARAWEQIYTTANANLASVDWNVKELILLGDYKIAKANANALGIYTTSGQAGVLYTKSILCSDGYNDYGLIPTNGLYSKGEIKSGTALRAPVFYGKWDDITSGQITLQTIGDANLNTVLPINANQVRTFASGFREAGTTMPATTNYVSGIRFRHYINTAYESQLGFGTDGTLSIRTSTDSGIFAPWSKVWDSGNSNTSTADWVAQSFIFSNSTKLTSTTWGIGAYTSAGEGTYLSVRGLTASDSFSDTAKVPTNGIYSKGVIHAAGGCRIDGTLSVYPTTNNYTEGIRIANSSNNWSLILLGAIGSEGTSSNSWVIGRDASSRLIFDRDNSLGSLGNGMTLDTTGSLSVKHNLASNNGYVIANSGWFQNGISGTGLYNAAENARWYASAGRWYSDKSIYTEGYLSANRISVGYDPAVNGSIGCSNWFRSSGDTGWYSSTYSGGWHMKDTTYLRTYGEKSIYTGAGHYLAGGANETSDSTTLISKGRYRVDHVTVNANNCTPVLSWGNTIAAQGYVCRMGIGSYRPSTSWGRMYFAIGNNDAGTSSVTHYMDAAGIYATGLLSGNNLSITSTATLGTTTVNGALQINGEVKTSGWYRSTGSVGWFNETYSGGIWMNDSTWVRVYNGKAFYVENSGPDAIHTAGGVNATGRIYAGGNIDGNLVTSRSWIYSTGNTGWYNATHDGGMYMTGSWVSAYMKPIYIGNSHVVGIGGHNVALKLYNPSHIGLNLANNAFTWGIYSNTNGLLYLGRRVGNVDDTSGDYALTIGGSGGTMTYNGNFSATGSVTARSVSDIRLKENIVPIEDALSIISQLHPFYHTWKQTAFGYDANLSKGYDVGLSAQESEKIYPFAVSNLMDTGFLALEYQKFIPLTIAAINELDCWKDKKDIEIEQLRKRVSDLENQLNVA